MLVRAQLGLQSYLAFVMAVIALTVCSNSSCHVVLVADCCCLVAGTVVGLHLVAEVGSILSSFERAFSNCDGSMIRLFNLE